MEFSLHVFACTRWETEPFSLSQIGLRARVCVYACMSVCILTFSGDSPSSGVQMTNIPLFFGIRKQMARRTGMWCVWECVSRTWDIRSFYLATNHPPPHTHTHLTSPLIGLTNESTAVVIYKTDWFTRIDSQVNKAEGYDIITSVL